MLETVRGRRPELVIVVALAATCGALWVHSVWALALGGLLPLPRVLGSRGARQRLGRRARSLLVVATTAVVIRGLVMHAISAGALLGLRIAVAALATSWLTEVLDAAQLDRGLGRLGVPRALVELLALTRRFAAQLQGTMTTAWTAAALRGGFGSWRALTSTAGPVAGVVLLRALDRSQRVAISLALRGQGAIET